MPDRVPFRVKPMLATLVAEPVNQPGWVYEEKYDGYRILAYKEGKKVTLLSRNFKDRTQSFSEVAKAVAALPSKTLLLDGEVVAFDSKLVSRFQLLQQGEVPYVYMVFDCLYRDGEDLRSQPLPVRRRAVEEAIGAAERLFASRRLPGTGLAAFQTAEKKGWEGIVAKDPTAPYIEARSSKWLKFKVHQREEFVIVGFTPPGGIRSYFGSLLLAAHRGKELRYVGRVGTGFNEKTLKSLYSQMRPMAVQAPPVVNDPRIKGTIWIEPKLIAQVSFHEWTDDERLRQPVYQGLRDDKKASEVVFPKAAKL